MAPSITDSPTANNGMSCSTVVGGAVDGGVVSGATECHHRSRRIRDRLDRFQGGARRDLGDAVGRQRGVDGPTGLAVALDLTDALVVGHRDADTGEADQRRADDAEADGSLTPLDGNGGTRPTIAAEPFAEPALADRHLDESVAGLGDRQCERHRPEPLRQRHLHAGLAADDLVDRPVVEVQAVAARADPVEHGVAEQATHASRVGGSPRRSPSASRCR